MARNDVAGERVYHARDILREFMGHNFVSGLCTLKPKNLLRNLGFSNPVGGYWYVT